MKQVLEQKETEENVEKAEDKVGPLYKKLNMCKVQC